MKLLLRKNIISVLVLLAVSVGCTKLMPTAAKPNVPEDHTKNIHGVLHKPGYEEPMEFESGCSERFCHGTALEGAVVIIDEGPVVAPSCFQCHEDKWNNATEENSAPALKMLLKLLMD